MNGATINLKRLDHVNVRVPPRLYERVRRFYCDVIGLRDGWIPGAADGSACWLYLGDQPVLHLIGRGEGADEPKPTGWIDHVAFSCSDEESARARLDALGVSYVHNRFPEAKIAQFLLRDPAGIQVELNFFGEDAAFK